MGCWDSHGHGSRAGGFGFTACPVVTLAVELLQLCVFWGVLQWTHRSGSEEHLFRCFPDEWSLFSRDVYAQVPTFLELHIPKALALASDFWRVSAIGWMSSWPEIAGAGIFNSGYRLLG